MPRRIPERNRATLKALRSAGVSAAKAAAIVGVSPETAKRAGAAKQSGANATRGPLAGAESSERALGDLNEQREILLVRLRSDDVSSRDLASVSAELRKVNASITQLELLSRANDDGEPEEVRDAAARVRARLEKITARAEPVAEAQENPEPLARVAG